MSDKGIVVMAGPATHPHTGKHCMCILTDKPWPLGWLTNVWAQPDMPQPAGGSELTWDHKHVYVPGGTYKKLCDDTDAGRNTD